MRKLLRPGDSDGLLSHIRASMVAVGGLMSYGTSLADSFRQVGVYTGTATVAGDQATLATC
jgi:hypothetical protein